MKIEDIRTVHALAELGLNPSAIRQLMRIERTLHHLAERQCNGDGWGPREWANGRSFPAWGEGDDARCEKREKSLMAKAQALCDEIRESWSYDGEKLLAYHQGDPRGGALYIVKESELKGRDIGSCYSSCGVAV